LNPVLKSFDLGGRIALITGSSASGKERALRSAVDVLCPHPVIVQVGLGSGEMSLPINTILARSSTFAVPFAFTRNSKPRCDCRCC
jgi:hypothetical protein